MNGDRWPDLAMYGLMLLLPLSALLARRMPIGMTLKLATAWAAIFAVGIVLVTVAREPIASAWQSVSAGLRDQNVSGRTVRIRMADDGHFYAEAMINGVPRRMLIDSGATTTAISVDTASAAGLDMNESPFPTMLNTANGRVVAKVSTVKHLVVGTITASDLAVVVAPEFGESDVIGMNFLSRLKGWKVEGTTLVLEPAL